MKPKITKLDFDYDAFIRDLEECHRKVEPSWVIARDAETAEAFAQWCVDNGLERPLMKTYIVYQ